MCSRSGWRLSRCGCCPSPSGLQDKAGELTERLKAAGLRAALDTRNEKIGYKIREAQMQKIPYMLVIGDREAESGMVSVRSHKEGDLGTMTEAEFLEKVQKEVADKAR